MLPKIAGEHRDWLIERAHAATFTLRGLVAELAERGLQVDYRIVWKFVHRERLSLKKPCWPASRIVRTSRASEADGTDIKDGLIRGGWSSSMVELRRRSTG